MNFFLYSRYQKEVPPASHLSPVKKRVKENTPPDQTHFSVGNWSSGQSGQQQQTKGRHHHGHHHGNQRLGVSPRQNNGNPLGSNGSGGRNNGPGVFKEQRQTIVIGDSPSPAVSVITISSDSDDEPRHSPKM